MWQVQQSAVRLWNMKRSVIQCILVRMSMQA